MRVGAFGKHRNVIQGQVELGGQAMGGSAARCPKAHRNMRTAEAIGKRTGSAATPVIDGLAAKDVESHFRATPVQQ
jgi:hypothetical protein